MVIGIQKVIFMQEQVQNVAQGESLGMIRHLKLMTLLEGGSLILLVLIAVPLKHIGDMPQMVSIVGPIHGIFFLWMVAILGLVLSRRQLPWVDGLITFVAAFIPFGGLFSHHRVDRAIQRLQAQADAPQSGAEKAQVMMRD